MFEELLKVVPLVASAFQWLLTQNDKEREEFASLCERISETLDSFAKASDDERQSRNLCAELKVYVPDIANMAKVVLADNQLKDMAQALSGACDTWNKHAENHGKNSHIFASDLFEVHEAAGHFRGLAEKVRNKWG